MSALLFIQFTVCPGFSHTCKFSGYCLTIYVFKVILLLLLNIYWGVTLGGQHFVIWLPSATAHCPKHHADVVIPRPRRVHSGQRPTVASGTGNAANGSLSQASLHLRVGRVSGSPRKKLNSQRAIVSDGPGRGMVNQSVRSVAGAAKRWEWLGVRRTRGPSRQEAAEGRPAS